MKAIVAVALLFAGCGGGKCSGSHTGHWVGTTVADSVDLGDDCVFGYHGVGGCQSQGTYANPLTGQGQVRVAIDASGGGNCLPVGNLVCAYAVSSKTLTLDCGAGGASYSR